jgi:hypothetical protein
MRAGTSIDAPGSRGVALLPARPTCYVSAVLRLVLVALLVPLLVGSARADEKEFLLAIQPQAAMLRIGDQNAWGGGGAIDLNYGITDALAVRVTGAATVHAVPMTMTDPGGTLLAYHAGAGFTYTIDILRLVPYVDFDIGLLGTSRVVNGERQTENHLGMELGVGVDYLINRRYSVGIVARYHAYLTALSEIPVYLYFGPRFAIRFGG